MEGEHCLVGQDTVRSWYQGNVDSGALAADPAQERVVERLQLLSNELAELDGGPGEGLISSLLSGKAKKEPPRGVYIHGSVGRGKSYLVDGFFLNLPTARKLRVHFHGFMRHYHEDVKGSGADGDDALVKVASSLSERFDLICFDEFHVSDIADAMILSRMLEVLLDAGTVLVATSNYSPDGLYPNGLARDRFLPAIALIKERLDVVSLDGDTDYRFRALSDAGLYLSPVSEENERVFEGLFGRLALGMTLKPRVKVAAGRVLPARQRTSDAIWLDYAEVCGGNYGQADYLKLGERFATVFVSGVPRLGTAGASESTRRFTWLVDVLYDLRVKLVLLAEHGLGELFEGEGGESGRTLSRLKEMQSQEYLSDSMRVPQQAGAGLAA